MCTLGLESVSLLTHKKWGLGLFDGIKTWHMTRIKNYITLFKHSLMDLFFFNSVFLSQTWQTKSDFLNLSSKWKWCQLHFDSSIRQLKVLFTTHWMPLYHTYNPSVYPSCNQFCWYMSLVFFYRSKTLEMFCNIMYIYFLWFQDTGKKTWLTVQLKTWWWIFNRIVQPIVCCRKEAWLVETWTRLKVYEVTSTFWIQKVMSNRKCYCWTPHWHHW